MRRDGQSLAETAQRLLLAFVPGILRKEEPHAMCEGEDLLFSVQELPQSKKELNAIHLAMRNQRQQKVHLAASLMLHRRWQKTWCAERCSIVAYAIL
jgi:hypothetical protein